MADLPPSPRSAVFHIDHKRRKITPERAKANYLRLRLQYARLKVEHGWQRQTLNEVENLYFRHTHKSRPPTTSKSGARRNVVSHSARYTPNMLFPVNEICYGHDAALERLPVQKEFNLGPTVESGSVSGGVDDVSLSLRPAVPSSIPPVETHAVSDAVVQQSERSRRGPDSGTLEQAAASMFTPQFPASSPHTEASQSANGLAPPPIMVDPTFTSVPNGVMPTHFQPASVSFGANGPGYPQAGQDQFYPAQPLQYEFHFHTPSQQQQDLSQLQVPAHTQPQSSESHSSPQSHDRQLGSFTAVTPALSSAQQAPPNPTLTYDAFWSSHSLSSTQSYRNGLFNAPGLTFQASSMPATNARPNPGFGGALAQGGVPVSAPMSVAGLTDAAANHAPTVQNS
ncbi:hypothetical protein DAEQUDRAFT_602666 [Daedalea quercina L-15889]|uniref:Uncharacterized protein n=1 Tax=Daedalea quercina L-15889 TaxID=1314783 RepID=A0A165LLK6_9APHY|nr:hypothetical protein DAEQUDRAFT_602666 [Daedalea quercina L-15889]